MKAKIFLLTFFLSLALFSCGGSDEISSSKVDDGSNNQPICNNDGNCSGDETVNNCPADCHNAPVCDNDGTCEAGETQQNCGSDCHTAPVCDNDGTCDAGENQQNCSHDCTPPGENHAPSFTPVDSLTVTIGTNINFHVQATDEDGDKVTLSWEIPSGASFANVTNNATMVKGDFSWTPTTAGTYTAKFWAADNAVDSKTGTLTVTIKVTATPPPDHVTGTLSYAGLNYIFDFTAQKITLTNTNLYVVRLCGSFYCNKFVEAGAVQTFDAGCYIGQQIEIQIWKGDAAAWYPELHGNSVDLVGRAILDDSAITANTAYSEWNTYETVFAPITGLYCQLSGRYNKLDTTKQSNHTLFCYNTTSNYMKVELYHIVPDHGSWYKNDAKLGTILSIAPNRGEIIKVDYTYLLADMLAVRVSAPTQTIVPYMLEMDKDDITKVTFDVTITD